MRGDAREVGGQRPDLEEFSYNLDKRVTKGSFNQGFVPISYGVATRKGQKISW